MRNKIIGLVVAVVILVASVVIYATIGNEPTVENPVTTKDPQATPAPTATPKTKLIDVALADTKYITIENPGQDPIQLGHAQTGSGEDLKDVYSLVSHADVAFEETELSTLFSVMRSLYGKKLAEDVVEGTTDADYGFDKATKVTLELHDGTTYVVEVGNHTPAKDGTFARMAGAKDIYTITYGQGLYLKSDLNDLKNKTLYYADSDAFINRIQMKKNGELQYVLEGSKIPDSEVEEWKVTAPVYWDLTYDSKFLIMTGQFYNIVATDVVEETTDFAKYGLEVPAYEVVFWEGDKQYTLALGNLTEDGAYYYMRWNNGNEVYEISTSQFTELDRQLKDMVGSIIYYCTYWDLSKFEVNYKGIDYVFEIGENKDNDTAKDVLTYNGKMYSDAVYPNVCEAFRNVYKSAASLWAYEFDPTVSPELKDPEITFVYHNRVENEVVTLQYVRRDADRLYVFMNGKYTGALAQNSAIYAPSGDLSPGIDNTLPDFEAAIKAAK